MQPFYKKKKHAARILRISVKTRNKPFFFNRRSIKKFAYVKRALNQGLVRRLYRHTLKKKIKITRLKPKRVRRVIFRKFKTLAISKKGKRFLASRKRRRRRKQRYLFGKFWWRMRRKFRRRRHVPDFAIKAWFSSPTKAFRSFTYYWDVKSIFILLPWFTVENLLHIIINYSFRWERGNNRFTHFLKAALESIPFFYLKFRGVRLAITGKFDGKLRARTVLMNRGDFSLQKIDEKIRFTSSTTVNRYGAFGVRMWVVLS